MKKRLKSIVLSILMVFAVASLSACKDKEVEKKSPTVNVKVEEREFYVGEKLSDIEIGLTEGDTAGTIEWKTPETELVLGENTCKWKFSPEKSSKYESKTGSVKIVAVTPKENPTVNVVVTNSDVYAETKLSTVVITLSEGDTAGIIEWQDPETVVELGENEYAWKYVPTDTETYKQLTGKIKITAKAQVLTSIAVQTPQTKTAYKAFESFDPAGLILTATYNAGKVETVTQGWTIFYKLGTNLKAGDTSVTLSFGGKTCTAGVTVSKIEIDKPQVEGTYTYSGISLTAQIKQNAHSNLYTVSNNVYTVAGTHNVTVTLKDFANYKWKNVETASTTIPFVINKADLVVQKNNYSGVYDALPHKATVSALSSTVYYSTTELNSSNYTSGSTTPIEFVDAINAKVYFYIAGDNNHNDMISHLTVDIQKANAVVSTEYCYSVVGNKNASVPLGYVSVFGVNNDLLSTASKLDFVYYTSYTDESNNQKTTTTVGATSDGGAPKTAGRYVVKTIYTGSNNYASSTGLSILLIDTDDCSLLAHNDENDFAWRSTSIDQLTVDAYFEINKQDTGSLIELIVSSKFDGEIVEGKVIKQDGLYKFVSADETYVISSVSSSINLINEDQQIYKSLTKWELPNFVGTFERDTVTSDDTTPNSKLVISHEYGVLTFVYTYYYSSGSVKSGEKTGYVTFSTDSLSFLTIDGDVSSLFANASNIDNSSEVLSITLGGPLTPPSLKGAYTKV